MQNETLYTKVAELEETLEVAMKQVKSLAKQLAKNDGEEYAEILQSKLGLPVHTFLTADDGILEVYSFAIDAGDAEEAYSNPYYDDSSYEDDVAISDEEAAFDDTLDDDLLTSSIDSFDDDLDDSAVDSSFDPGYGEGYDMYDGGADDGEEDPYEPPPLSDDPAENRYNSMFSGLQDKSAQLTEEAFSIDNIDNPAESDIYQPFHSGPVYTPKSPTERVAESAPAPAGRMQESLDPDKQAGETMTGWQSLVKDSPGHDIGI